MRSKLYWNGNAAKTKVIDEILSVTEVRRAQGEIVTLFEYGCGGAGDWPVILAENKGFRLIGYEPHGPSYEKACSRLRGFDVELYTGNQLAEKTFFADYGVSFSVFEHVYDRMGYLATVKRHLAPGGTFYLNYDDGHFRNFLDLSVPKTWATTLSEFSHNLLAGSLARLGKVGYFQKRVNRADADALVPAAGLVARDSFYSNLGSMKALAKTLPESKRGEFSRLWVELEDALNAKFKVEGPARLGDTLNLWPSMGSRTLVLEHA